MLEDLINGHESSKFVLLSDTSNCPARHLFINWIEKLIKRSQKVVLLCCERQPKFYKSWLPPELHHQVVFLDDKSLTSGLELSVRPFINPCSGQTSIMIDSLTPNLLQSSSPSVCNQLHKLYKS